MIVVDASVVVTALGDDGHDGRRVRQRLSGEDLAAPELVDVEVTSAFTRMALQGDISPARAERAIGDLAELRLDLVSHRPLLSRCWQLRENLTPYDGVYVALAELLDALLVTADRRLVEAPGPTCRFELLA